MIRQNLHTHTRYDDGKNTPEEMARAALGAGLTSLGFSGHSVLPYENDWSLTERSLAPYLADVERTRAAFAEKLTIYSGLEWDAVSPQSTEGFDYVIGSLHHIRVHGHTPSVDASAEETKKILRLYFDGDKNAMAEAYFAQYAALASSGDVDIVGHFDLLSKFDETDGIFDGGVAYMDCAMAALEALCRADKIFEVNTGAMARGCRTGPYPSTALLRELRARGARVLVASDAHSAEKIAWAFQETEALLRSLGFRETWELTDNGFAPVPIFS